MIDKIYRKNKISNYDLGFAVACLCVISAMLIQSRLSLFVGVLLYFVGKHMTKNNFILKK